MVDLLANSSIRTLDLAEIVRECFPMYSRRTSALESVNRSVGCSPGFGAITSQKLNRIEGISVTCVCQSPVNRIYIWDTKASASEVPF